jgi:GT2 family glycosyltransferase
MMIRRSMVKEVGLMDEDLFLLCSDSDYCLRAREAGWSVWYIPTSKVLHRLNASKKPSEWHKKDMATFMKKWGLTPRPDGGFNYSERFAKLDMFP